MTDPDQDELTDPAIPRPEDPARHPTEAVERLGTVGELPDAPAPAAPGLPDAPGFAPGGSPDAGASAAGDLTEAGTVQHGRQPDGADEAVPRVPDEVAAVHREIGLLAGLDDLPVAEHVERYEALHGRLQEALAGTGARAPGQQPGRK